MKKTSLINRKDITRIILLSILYSGFFFFYACNDKKESYHKYSEYQVEKKSNSFAGSESCKECHLKQYKDWKNSHHDLSMQIANSKNVLGDFNQVEFKSKGIQYFFFKKNEDYYVNTQDIDGEYRDFKITYTFGVDPLQQYIVDFKKGRKQCLTVAWDVKGKKWFDLLPDDIVIKPGDWMHWTGGSMTWNNMCADCHSTNVHKNYNPKTDTYNTTFTYIDVSCESCHGVASNHISYYKNPNKNKQEPPKFYMDSNTLGKDLVQKCARCHSRRNQLTPYFDYKGHFFDHYNPSLIEQPVYELDGQIKDEDFEYGSFVQSKMYQHNIACNNCHDSHTLKLKKTGNDLCLQCHNSTYDKISHHKHQLNTQASLCVNCHMTGKYYMKIDFRRDHSFRIPRPDQSQQYGTPNACNKCHKDKTEKWASKAIENWYGKERKHHFTDDLLKGYQGDINALEKVIDNNNYPEIIRATALSQYGNYPLDNKNYNQVANYVNDISALVRNQTINVFSKNNQIDATTVLKPLLLDSVRLVRISAARYFSVKNPEVFNKEIYKKALQEYLTQLEVNADFASGQHQIALYYQANGDIQKAIEHYKKAIKIDRYFNISRINLALLEFQKGNTKKAEKLYLKVIEQEPEYSYPYFMLGLLYNEIGNEDASLKYLKKACEKQPFIPRACYNYALKLQQKNDYKTSINVINKALSKDSLNQDLLYIKFLAEIKLNKKKQAKSTLEHLLNLNPRNKNYLKLLDSIN